jgi:DNA (cytosine-5)-methyltransferase 1
VSRKTTNLTASDLFCGAGGSSHGAEQAGVEIRVAANHWPRACETYGLNHSVQPDCADVSQVNPRRYPHTDLLLASPECKWHSSANAERRRAHDVLPGFESPRKDEADRSRATMWDVIRFSEWHEYELVIIENVVEVATKWPPYQAWLQGMQSIGYEFREVCLNSMFFGVPQSRDRLYVVFWRRGNRAPELDFRPRSWCQECEAVVEGVQTWKGPRRLGKYRSQYVYVCSTCRRPVLPLVTPALAAIDWSLKGERIGDRRHPLKPATMARIQAGIDRYWRPLLVPLDHQPSSGERDRKLGSAAPLDGPMATLTGRRDKGLAFLPLLTTLRGTAADQIASSAALATDPMRTISAQGNPHGLLSTSELLPLYLKAYTGEVGYPVTHPLGAITAIDHHQLLTPPSPLLVSYYSRPDTARSVGQPMATITVEPRHGLVQPPDRAAFLTSYYRSATYRDPALEPMGTLTSLDRHALVERGPLPTVQECFFRMLQTHEHQAGMAFPRDYVITGDKREQTAQLGNAVTPPPFTWLTRQAIASLHPELRAA